MKKMIFLKEYIKVMNMNYDGNNGLYIYLYC